MKTPFHVILEIISDATRWVDRLVSPSLSKWENRNKDEENYNINVIISCDSPSADSFVKISQDDIFADYFCSDDKSIIGDSNTVLVKAPHEDSASYSLPSDSS